MQLVSPNYDKVFMLKLYEIGLDLANSSHNKSMII